jgi:microcompartment protein CcmK/EutM
MEIARVTGTVTATVKDESLNGRKLLMVVRVDARGSELAPVEVAVDSQGAGVGDTVLIVRGSAARQPSTTRSAASDLTIVAIVDHVSERVSEPPSKASPKKRSKA